MNLPKLGSSNQSGSGGMGISLVWVIIGGVIIIVGGVFISLFTPSIFPTQGSAESVLIDNLFRFMLFIGGAIFLLVEGLLLISVVRFRQRKGERADGPPNQGNTTLELVWTVIPAIIVTILSLYAFVVWQQIETVPANTQNVSVLGQRFAWTFGYEATTDDLPPDVDMSRVPEALQHTLTEGGAITFSSPQMHTWVNQTVYVTIDTEDVNHAFWIPGMRLKQDALAGYTTDMHFTPIEAGVYRIVCAELCGGGHGNMAGIVTEDGDLSGAWLIVHPDEETYLREFYYPSLETVLYPPDDPVALGRQVIQNYPCSGCHRLEELGWVGVTGPNLTGVASRTSRLNATGYATMEEYIRSSIRHPSEYVVPGYNNIMPPFNDDPSETNYMSEADWNAIVAFLLTQTGS